MNTSMFSSPSDITFIPYATSSIFVLLNLTLVTSPAGHETFIPLNLSQNNSLFIPSAPTTKKKNLSKIDPGIRIVWLIFGPIIFIAGVCGNIFVLFIMTRKIMGGTSTCVHLSVMAVADLTVTLIGLTPEWFEICFDAAFKEIHPATCKIEKFFFYTAADVSVWILVIFSLDRYIAVCHPLRKKSVCTTSRARLFAITTILLAMVKNSHVFWTRGIQYKLDNATNKLIVRKLCGTTHPDYEYFESYVRSWVVFIFVNGLPALVISICNLFIVKSMFALKQKSSFSSLNFGLASSVPNVADELAKSTFKDDDSEESHAQKCTRSRTKRLLSVDFNKSRRSLLISKRSISSHEDFRGKIDGRFSTDHQRRSISVSSSPLSSQTKQHPTLKSLTVSSTQPINNKALLQMTAMCLSASICFLVCNTPSVVLYVGREYWEKNEGYYVFKPMYNIFVYVNHAVNFLLYCLTGQRFRRVFVDLLCRKRFYKNRATISRRYSDWGDSMQNSVAVVAGSQNTFRNLKHDRSSNMEAEEMKRSRRNTTIVTNSFLESIEEAT